MENKSNGAKIIIAILVIVILVLVLYIALGCKGLVKEVPVPEAAGGVGADNQALTVMDNIEIDNGEDYEVILRIKNTSSKAWNNRKPVLIYYDNDNLPIHEAWGARISYLAAGDERCVQFYDTIKDYSKVEVGLFEWDEDDDYTYTDMRDQIEYDVKKAEEPDEDGEIRLNFKGKNKSDKGVLLEFEVDYYSGDDLIYADNFVEVVEAKEDFETYEALMTKFENGKAFPEGYTYDVKLVEAVDVNLDEEEELSDEEDDTSTTKESSKIDVESLNDKEKIEHVLYQKLKEVYGDKLASAKIYVDKVYTAKEVESNSALKSLGLGKDDIPFEVSIHIEPAEGADYNVFLVPNGEYDKDSGWVKNVTRTGVLSKDENGKYTIENLGTGW